MKTLRRAPSFLLVLPRSRVKTLDGAGGSATRGHVSTWSIFFTLLVERGEEIKDEHRSRRKIPAAREAPYFAVIGIRGGARHALTAASGATFYSALWSGIWAIPAGALTSLVVTLSRLIGRRAHREPRLMLGISTTL
jgi:hypothetical protein